MHAAGDDPLEDLINRDVPIPLYYQICQYVRTLIDSGKIKPGEQIPTEAQLQQLFGVSRATVRRAISDLAYEGLLERRRSKGTLVARTRLEETLYGFASFTNSVFKSKKTPESKVLDFRVTRVDGGIADFLGIGREDDVATMKRIRYVDGEPVAVENWYAPVRHLPGIDRSFFKETGIEQSTYHMLQERYGIQLTKAVDTMSSVALDKEDAELLRRERHMPVLLRTRISYNSAGVPITYSSGRYIITLIINFEKKVHE